MPITALQQAYQTARQQAWQAVTAAWPGPAAPPALRPGPPNHPQVGWYLPKGLLPAGWQPPVDAALQGVATTGQLPGGSCAVCPTLQLLQPCCTLLLGLPHPRPEDLPLHLGHPRLTAGLAVIHCLAATQDLPATPQPDAPLTAGLVLQAVYLLIGDAQADRRLATLAAHLPRLAGQNATAARACALACGYYLCN